MAKTKKKRDCGCGKKSQKSFKPGMSVGRNKKKSTKKKK